MSWLGDVGSFESFNLKGILSDIGKNPARMLYGSADPFSTNVWNGVFGTDDKPLVDQWGGAAKHRYQEAEDAGINTGPGATMHGVARTIAGMFAGGAAGNAMNGAGSAANAGGGINAGSSGVGFGSGGAPSAPGMGGGTGITSNGLLGSSGNVTASNSPGILAQFQEGYGKVKPYMDAVKTGMQTAQSLEGEQAPMTPPPQITPSTANPALNGLLAQMNSIETQRAQEDMARKQKRYNLIRG